jgi:transposase
MRESTHERRRTDTRETAHRRFRTATANAHLARFIADLVDEHLDLSGFYAGYKEGRGGPPFDPRLMVRVLLMGYTTGIRSSRKLEAAYWDIVAFRWLAGGQAPAYRAIAKFRKRHLSALGHVFVQALELCQAAGMLSLGRVALDGTKVRANASRRKAMSYAGCGRPRVFRIG